MQRTADYFRNILVSRGVWNFFVAGSVFAGLAYRPLLDLVDFRVAEPPMWMLVVGGFIFVSGVLNLMASRRLVDYRPVLYNDIAGRAWYILVYILFSALGHSHWMLTMIAAGDTLMIVLGIDYLRHYPKLAAA